MHPSLLASFYLKLVVMNFKDELDSLASSSLSEWRTPRHGGAAIGEMTQVGSNLTGQFEEEETTKGIGKSEVRRSFGEEENKKYQIATVMQLGGSSLMCREKRSGGLNTFCLKESCNIQHRNGNSPKVNVSDDDIVVLKGKEIAFISPRGSAKKVHPDMMKEWLRSEATLAEWSHRFMLATVAETDVSTKSNLQEADLFAKRAEEAKTPKKIPLKVSKVDSFKSSFNREKIKREAKLQPGGIGKVTLDYFEEIADQFQHVESVLNQMMLNSSSNLDQVLSALRMMDFEKNKMKRESGNRKDVLISENFDATSVWQTVSMMSECLEGEGVKREAHAMLKF